MAIKIVFEYLIRPGTLVIDTARAVIRRGQDTGDCENQ